MDILCAPPTAYDATPNRSPLGGKLSPAEEWKRLQDAGSFGRELALTTGAMAKAVVEASTPEEFRFDTTYGTAAHLLLRT